MKRLAICLALLGLVPVVGCGSKSSETTKTQTASKSKTKPKKKKADPRDTSPTRPAMVFGPGILEDKMKSIEDPDPQVRATAWVGIMNMAGVAKEKLPELKKQYAKEKDATVKKRAKRALERIADAP